MASLIYNSFFLDIARGAIDCDADTFKIMLVSSTYGEAKTHSKRSDITNEITGTGYTAGGVTATVTLTLDNPNNKLNITLGGVEWNPATFTARKAVYYKSRGDAASDELVAIVDFGSDVTATAAPFTLTASTLSIQN
jgi:hypothetical protein